MKCRILVIFLTFFVFNNSFSQELSKKEKKALAKEIKLLLKNPLKYKLMKESLTMKQSIIQEQVQDLISLKRENSNTKSRLSLSEDSINLCLKKIKQLENTKPKEPLGIDNSGIKYRVQIGKYKEFDISSFFEKRKSFIFEKGENGNFVYSIGNFETEYDAEMFKSFIREIGIKDAFVSYYSNGLRFPKD